MVLLNGRLASGVALLRRERPKVCFEVQDGLTGWLAGSAACVSWCVRMHMCLCACVCVCAIFRRVLDSKNNRAILR